MIALFRAARAVLRSAPPPPDIVIAGAPPSTPLPAETGLADFVAVPSRRAPRAASASAPASPEPARPKRRPGRKPTKPRAQPICPVCRTRHRQLDPGAVRALAAAKFGKARAAAAQGVTLYGFRKLLAANAQMAEAWHHGRLDVWRSGRGLKRPAA